MTVGRLRAVPEGAGCERVGSWELGCGGGGGGVWLASAEVAMWCGGGCGDVVRRWLGRGCGVGGVGVVGRC